MGSGSGGSINVAQGAELFGYETLMELASGGMGTAYVARRAGVSGFERLVVLKRMHPHLAKNADLAATMRDEARVAALIRSPHVVPVEDVIEDAGELLLVQPYVESVSLSQLLRAARARTKRLAPAVVTRILCDVLLGLHAAHEACDLRGNRLDVVHRDVSPQNILVSETGHSLLIDFGIAKAARRVTETKSGVLKGKPAYMAPEQLKAQDIDRRADLFAAGAVLYEALVGERLFQGEDEAELLLTVMLGDVPSLKDRWPEAPDELDSLLARTLERNPDNRPSTADELRQALESALPPADVGEVGKLVNELCGEQLAARRTQLFAAMDEGQKTRPEKKAAAPEKASVSTAEEGLTPSPVDKDAAPTRAESQTSFRRRSRWVLGVALAVGVAAALLVRGTFGVSGVNAGPAPGPSQVSESARPVEAPSAPPATPEAAQIKETVLSLRGPRAIESVRATGLVEMQIDGSKAEVRMRPWLGMLEVEVSYPGGQRVTVTVPETGPFEVDLPEPKAQRPAPSAAPKPSSKGPGLHQNPYESH